MNKLELKWITQNNRPVGITIGDINSTNDGDVVIYNILLHVLSRRRPGDIIVDVGACDAAFSLVCANSGTGTGAGPIYAFEPNKKSYFSIIDYLKRNSVKDIYVFPLAISTRDREVVLEEAGGSSNIREGTSASTNTLTCICKPLSDIIEPSRRIFFMKIDTEGCDIDVLETCRPFMDGPGGIDHIVFEYTPFWLGENVDKAVSASVPMFTYLSTKFKYMYSLSRRGTPFLVGPLSPADYVSFIVDHYDRHLQTDIYVCNEAVDFLPVMPHKVGAYYA